MKDTKREHLFLYAYYDRVGIAEHLEQMAAKGWMLEKIHNSSWQYHRIEPKQIHFSVVYFPTASHFDPAPSSQLETLRDFCAEAGWQLAADAGQLQVFYNEFPDPLPIETDPKVQLQNLHQAMKRSFLLGYWMLFALSIFYIAMSFWQIWENPIHQLSRPLSLLSFTAYLPMLLLSGSDLFQYYFWRKRAAANIEAGAPLPELRSNRTRTLLILILVALQVAAMLILSFRTSRIVLFSAVLLLLFIPLIALLTNSAKGAMKHLNISAKVNRLVTGVMLIALSFGLMMGLVALVFVSDRIPWLQEDSDVEFYEYQGHTWEIHHDEIPLRVEDLTGVDYDQYSTEADRSESFLLAHTEYHQRPRIDTIQDIPDLDYDILEIKAAFLYDLCKQELLTKYWYHDPVEYRDHYIPLDTPVADTTAVYRQYDYAGNSRNRYLICWPDRLVEIHFGWDATAEQLDTAARILKNA